MEQIQAIKSGIFFISAHQFVQLDEGSGPLLKVNLWLDSQLPKNQPPGVTTITRRTAEVAFSLTKEAPGPVRGFEWPNGLWRFDAPKIPYLAKVLEALRANTPILGLSVDAAGNITNFQFSGVNTLTDDA